MKTWRRHLVKLLISGVIDNRFCVFFLPALFVWGYSLCRHRWRSEGELTLAPSQHAGSEAGAGQSRGRRGRLPQQRGRHGLAGLPVWADPVLQAGHQHQGEDLSVGRSQSAEQQPGCCGESAPSGRVPKSVRRCPGQRRTERRTLPKSLPLKCQELRFLGKPFEGWRWWAR